MYGPTNSYRLGGTTNSEPSCLSFTCDGSRRYYDLLPRQSDATFSTAGLGQRLLATIGASTDTICRGSTGEGQTNAGVGQSVTSGSGLPLFDPRREHTQPTENTANPIAMAMRLTKTPALSIEHLHSMLSALTCNRAVNYLSYMFNSGKCWIKVNGMNTTPENLLRDLSCVTDMPADAIWPVEFVGGPPGRIRRYSGSLLTLLADRALTEASTGSRLKVETFLKSVR